MHISYNEEAVACTRDSHVHPSVVRREAEAAILICSHAREYDDVFFTALVTIHSIYLKEILRLVDTKGVSQQ